MKKDDLTIMQIRQIRHQISERFIHDPIRVIEYYIELQKKYKHRIFEESGLKIPEEGVDA